MSIKIAHRGDTINFPENTIQAFESAFDKGADGIELDVQCDKKGNIIVVHDYLHDQSKKYPLLKKVLEQFFSKGRIEIEIKSLELNNIKNIINLIKKINPPNFEVTSSILPSLPYIREELPQVNIGMIFKSYLIENYMTPKFIQRLLLRYMQLTKANILHLDLKHYTPAIVKIMHSYKFKTHTHLSDKNPNDYKKIKKLKIDQFTFDDITILEAK